mmetsp:Transcript_27516/g.66871  ORF Transcript_27516/g.66871 Transcript_27516/m.66871 type:complete len:208 (+) Transcript_27516:4344-4967(+)
MQAAIASPSGSCSTPSSVFEFNFSATTDIIIDPLVCCGSTRTCKSLLLNLNPPAASCCASKISPDDHLGVTRASTVSLINTSDPYRSFINIPVKVSGRFRTVIGRIVNHPPGLSTDPKIRLQARSNLSLDMYIVSARPLARSTVANGASSGTASFSIITNLVFDTAGIAFFGFSRFSVVLRMCASPFRSIWTSGSQYSAYTNCQLRK